MLKGCVNTILPLVTLACTYTLTHTLHVRDKPYLFLHYAGIIRLIKESLDKLYSQEIVTLWLIFFCPLSVFETFLQWYKTRRGAHFQSCLTHVGISTYLAPQSHCTTWKRRKPSIGMGMIPSIIDVLGYDREFCSSSPPSPSSSSSSSSTSITQKPKEIKPWHFVGMYISITTCATSAMYPPCAALQRREEAL